MYKLRRNKTNSEINRIIQSYVNVFNIYNYFFIHLDNCENAKDNAETIINKKY